MKYKLFTNSKRTWDAMFRAIKKAKRTIYIEMYIFLDDTTASHDFITLLKRKARDGVSVAIVADAFGSLDLKKQTVLDMRAAGIELIFFSHFLRRTHRKIILVDNRIAFLGGVNIEKKIINWRDVHIRLEGRKTVKAILRSFAYTYRMCGGKNKKILHYYRKSILKKIKSLVLQSLPGYGDNSLLDYYKNKIISAKKSIKIVTPYFFPPRWLEALLDDAVRRGVEIKIIVPENTDIPTLNKLNFFYISRMAQVGLKFLMSRKMNHAKILIIDNREGLVGTQNIDVLSFGRNFEVGIFSRQKDIVKDLVVIFERWERQATPWQNQKNKLNFVDKIMLLVMRAFFSII
jgi:cardiolipin synthase